MRCTNHPKVESTGACVECGKLFCDDCIIHVGRKRYCKDCASELLKEDGISKSTVKRGGIVITQQTTNTQTQRAGSDSDYVPPNREGVKRAFKYVISIFFLISSLSFLINLRPIAILCLLTGVVWFPPFEDWLKENKNVIIPLWVKILLIVITIILMAV